MNSYFTQRNEIRMWMSNIKIEFVDGKTVWTFRDNKFPGICPRELVQLLAGATYADEALIANVMTFRLFIERGAK